MNTRLRFSIAVFCFSLWSCGESTQESTPISQAKPKKNILGTWQLAKVKKLSINLNEAKDPLLAEATQNDLVTQGLIYSFFSDHTFTKLDGNAGYTSDNWQAINQGRNIVMLAQKDTLQVVYANEGEQQMITLKSKSGTDLEFIKTDESLAKISQDPFHPSNNIWRIKATKSENTQEIQNRLGNYFQHLAYMLKSASDRDRPSINFAFSEGPVKIYNGGIGIKPDMPDSWVNTYFDRSEAAQAYVMFEKYLRESSYKGAGTQNWYIDDYNILVSIYGDLKAGKFSK